MFCFAALSHAMLAEVIQLHTTFKLVVSISLILVVLQSLKNMHFHPRLGIITRTLGGASDDLVFFSILFVMLHVIFAYLGVVVFGDYSEDFSSVSEAFLSCVEMLVGLYDPSDVMALSPTPNMAIFYVWFYQIICFFVLLNALLAIIVESYDRTKEESHTQQMATAYELFLRQWGFWTPDAELGFAKLSEADLIRIFKDLMLNLQARERVTVPGMRVHIKDEHDDEKVTPRQSGYNLLHNTPGVWTIIVL